MCVTVRDSSLCCKRDLNGSWTEWRTGPCLVDMCSGFGSYAHLEPMLSVKVKFWPKNTAYMGQVLAKHLLPTCKIRWSYLCCVWPKQHMTWPKFGPANTQKCHNPRPTASRRKPIRLMLTQSEADCFWSPGHILFTQTVADCSFPFLTSSFPQSCTVSLLST